jgi:uncharacterized protein YaeQ
LIGYSGRAFQIWWQKNADALARCANLEVIELPAGSAEALAGLLTRGMRLQCIVQEGEVQLMSESASVAVTPVLLQAATRG